MSEIRISYNRPVNGVYGMSANGVSTGATVTKRDGAFALTWLGVTSHHRTMKMVREFMKAAFEAKAVPLPAPSIREAGQSDIAALAAASKRARTAGQQGPQLVGIVMAALMLWAVMTGRFGWPPRWWAWLAVILALFAPWTGAA